MKKFIIPIILFIFTFFIAPVFADIVPMGSKSIKFYGIGVLNMPANYVIYEQPSKTSHIIREVNYENLKKSAIVNSMDMRTVSYIVYVPSENTALLPVETDNGDNWYNIYINQRTGKTGWVYCENSENFYTYKQLFYIYGKKFGIKFFNDLNENEKYIYAKQNKNSQRVGSFEYPKHVTFTVIQGNWILISINDLTGAPKVGWYNWRNDDGTLNMFPKFGY